MKKYYVMCYISNDKDDRKIKIMSDICSDVRMVSLFDKFKSFVCDDYGYDFLTQIVIDEKVKKGEKIYLYHSSLTEQEIKELDKFNLQKLILNGTKNKTSNCINDNYYQVQDYKTIFEDIKWRIYNSSTYYSGREWCNLSYEQFCEFFDMSKDANHFNELLNDDKLWHKIILNIDI